MFGASSPKPRVRGILAPRNGYAALVATVSLTWLAIASGCATLHRAMPSFLDVWDPGVEVRFPAAAEAEGESAPAGSNNAGDVDVEVVAAPDRPMPPVQRLVRDLAAVALATYDKLGLGITPRKLKGTLDYEDTTYTLLPGTYAFEYDAPSFRPVYGAAHVYTVSTPRARDFIRHTSIVLTPSAAGTPSVLTEADLDRARNGDVVTKVVFIAHNAAVRTRLDKIDRGLRELGRIKTSLTEQLAYWDRKLTERRVNTQYSSDFGWGVDVPGWDLALLQTLVGPERYHWHRFSRAEDKVRTYEEKIARLELPERRLTEERDALTQVLHAADVIHRTNDLIVLAPSMIRPYHDPVREVHTLRGGQVWADSYSGKVPFELNDWVGPWGKVHFPYWYSSLAMAGLAPGLWPVAGPSATLTKSIGEVLMVVQIGARKPAELR